MTLNLKKLSQILVFAGLIVTSLASGMGGAKLGALRPKMAKVSAVCIRSLATDSKMVKKSKAEPISWVSKLANQIKSTFDFSGPREQKIYNAFDEAFLKPGALAKIIAQSGNITYPTEFVNDLVSKRYSDGSWVRTGYTPLIFASKMFGNTDENTVWFDQKIDFEVLAQFRKKEPSVVEKVQYNLTQSLIKAGANASFKHKPLGSISFDSSKYDENGTYFRKYSPGSMFPLLEATRTYNLGAVKGLVDAGANVNESVGYITEGYRSPKGSLSKDGEQNNWSHFYDRFLLHEFKANAVYHIEESQDSVRAGVAKLYYPKILGVLTQAGAVESNADSAKRYPYFSSTDYDGPRDDYDAHGADSDYDEDKDYGSADQYEATDQQAANLKVRLCQKLNIKVGAQAQAIHSAYKRAISRIHPDRFVVGTTEHEEATKAAAELNSLYEDYKKGHI